MFVYRIYQLKREHFHGKVFLGYEETKKWNGEPQKEWYDLVYELKSEKELGPDDLFYIFNMEHPADFKGHSLSVSDVIEMEDGFWYCDSFGWVELDWRKQDGVY